MSGLFKKLNTLVRASINDTLGDVLPGDSRRRSIDPARLGKDMDREIFSLRERINEAIAHEETLRANTDTLRNQIAQLDQAADESVKQGDEVGARYRIEQMQRIQKRLEMAEADLREHQIVTQELIQRVNLLDAVVAEVRQQETGVPAEKTEVPFAENTESNASGPLKGLSDMLRDARESVTRADDAVQSEAGKAQINLDADVHSPDDQAVQAVDDDLAARLKRLSKPD